MERVLLILEVSQKQNFIFASKKLADNAARSDIIRYVTSEEFFKEVAGELYEEKNMVYSGGGHTVLQFAAEGAAQEFAKRVTSEAMIRFNGVELFAKCIPYDEAKTPAENLKELSKELERKKSQRKSSFHKIGFGVEKSVVDTKTDRKVPSELPVAPGNWEYPREMDVLAGKDNFIAVIHIDGNAMGKRVDGIYAESGNDWETCCKRLKSFSKAIQDDFDTSFIEMINDVVQMDDSAKAPNLPVRPVILAGDDVCFVTRGDIGLECSRLFLKHLTEKTNQEDGKPYAACAGVAMVHKKYPFHQAYKLAESLCDSAKSFGAELDQNGCVSAMDWHIEFGQLKGSLSDLRKEYETEDRNRMELRPVTVVVPKGIEIVVERSYDFFREMCRGMKGEYGKVARSKIKELRTALKQGEVEARFFLQDKQVGNFLYNVFDAKYQSASEKMEQYRKMFSAKSYTEKQAFVSVSEEKIKRSLFFDAIEMIDHWKELKRNDE